MIADVIPGVQAERTPSINDPPSAIRSATGRLRPYVASDPLDRARADADLAGNLAYARAVPQRVSDA
jgi:hypothetical protein